MLTTCLEREADDLANNLLVFVVVTVAVAHQSA